MSQNISSANGIYLEYRDRLELENKFTYSSPNRGWYKIYGKVSKFNGIPLNIDWSAVNTKNPDEVMLAVGKEIDAIRRKSE